ncbi:uncharacterized protein LOC134271145 [Saccostrea cucullata]|uniref:uncharacterized protein LOC134271145 n=1 Tax=Saccostrea cuccullata TaxID=36930 RepID=UPI002ED56181
MASFNELQGSVNMLKSQVSKLDERVTSVKNDVQNFDTDMKALGNVFDSVKDATEANKNQIVSNMKATEQCLRTQKQTENVLKAVNDANEALQNSVTDLKMRSMRDNLIFSGIPERRFEDTEAVLQDFIQRKYRLNYEISFERVHRMGKWNEFSEHPRNIVAKFTFYKDREFIRSRAPQKLKHSNVWVNEQFPPEIEERRRKLYPVLRQALKDHKRAKLVKDTLYIDGKEYIPSARSAPSAPVQSLPTWNSTSSYQPMDQQSTPQNTDRQALKRQRQGSTPEQA